MTKKKSQTIQLAIGKRYLNRNREVLLVKEEIVTEIGSSFFALNETTKRISHHYADGTLMKIIGDPEDAVEEFDEGTPP